MCLCYFTESCPSRLLLGREVTASPDKMSPASLLPLSADPTSCGGVVIAGGRERGESSMEEKPLPRHARQLLGPRA